METVHDSDRVVVIDEGSVIIIKTGLPHKLLTRPRAFKDLWKGTS